MEKISDQSKGRSKSLSPSRSSSLKSGVDHPSPKSPSDTQPIISPDSHQNYPESHSLIEKLEKVSISAEKPESSHKSDINTSSSLQPRRILTRSESQKT